MQKHNSVLRLLRYVAIRALVLILMLAAGLYLAVIVVNYNGYIDEIYRADIGDMISAMPPPVGMTPEQVNEYVRELKAQMEEAYGLNTPFLLRSARWTWKAATLQWGQARMFRSNVLASTQVVDIIAERIQNTLLLFATSNIILFLLSMAIAFTLSRRYSSRMDRAVTGLAFTSSVPNWIYGAVLTVILAMNFHILPWGGMIDRVHYDTTVEKALGIVRHMILPGLAIIISAFFQSITAWRTFFLMQSTEDYVEMALAKGLSPADINRKYILRPSLPYVITNFTMLMLASWQNSIALEVWFSWPGIGELFFRSVHMTDRTVVLSVIVTFAYILALTVFLLDIVYALVDPRIRVNLGEELTQRNASRRFRFASLFQKKKHLSSPFPAGLGRHTTTRARTPIRTRISRMGKSMAAAGRALAAHPASILGIFLILLLISVSIYTVIAIPYDQVVQLWRSDQRYWDHNPINARPTWINWFLINKLPESVIVDSHQHPEIVQDTRLENGSWMRTITFEFAFPYQSAPQDLVVKLDPTYREKKPFVSMQWMTPDGRVLDIASIGVEGQQYYYLSTDTRAAHRLGKVPVEGLFANPETGKVLPGTYQMRMVALTFEPESRLEAELLLYGKVEGWAGTDLYRRPLSLGLLWGAPVALVFGLVGALVTTLSTMILAGISAWFGGWVDDLIQRLSEVNMILPALPIAITVYLVYSKSIWVILAVIVILNVFGSSLKSYRALFLQARQSPFIEAAQAYGASNGRIIGRYLTPQILPMMIPQIIVLVPGYVFIESTLAFLRVSDIYLPTWGKIINDAFVSRALTNGDYFWVLEPIGLLLLTGLAFSLLGFGLERVLNPRLRTR